MSADERFAAYEAIQRFLLQARRPVAFEPGEEPIPLGTGCYDLRVDGSRLLFQMWTSDRNLLRRVTGIDSESSGQLNLTIERFGRKQGALHLLDASKPSSETRTRRA